MRNGFLPEDEERGLFRKKRTAIFAFSLVLHAFLIYGLYHARLTVKVFPDRSVVRDLVLVPPVKLTFPEPIEKYIQNYPSSGGPFGPGCPDVLAKKEGRIAFQRAVRGDALCSRCADACVYDALRLVGKRVTVEDLVAEVEKDLIFYEQSGGGVTFSGGEPLHQPEFLANLIDALKTKRFHLALDTSGLAPWEVLDRIARKCDLILYDLKIMDDVKHKEYTGVSNRLILDNLKRLASVGKEIWVRIPLVPGVNDDEGNIRRTADFLRPLPNIKRVSILPYHKGGCEKYTNLGKGAGFRAFEPPSEERVGAVLELLSGGEFHVRRGG